MQTLDSEEAMRSVEQANRLREIQNENHQLNQLVTKMKTISHWKQNFQRGIYARSVSHKDQSSITYVCQIHLRLKLIAVTNTIKYIHATKM